MNFTNENMCYILKEYLTHHYKYIEKYGENTVVLMQVGSFYEIYAVINEEINVGADVNLLGDILDIQVYRKNKKIEEISYSNYLGVGFPDHALLKFQNILLNHNYRIVLVNQVTAPPNPEREVTEIISPGTVVENFNNADTNILLSVFINVYPAPHNKKIYVIGLAAIDISTGQNYVHHIRSNANDEKLWTDELFRLIHYYNPREILFHFDSDEIDLSIDKITQEWEINHKTLHLNLCWSKEFEKPSYQNAYLKRVYPETGILTAIEFLGFERETEITLAYMYMIQFIHEHKIENLNGLPKPIFKGSDQHLILSHNCIYQLYLVENKEHSGERYNSLMGILNQCCTSIGRRLCKERILYPIVDPAELENRYAMISAFQKIYQDEPLYQHCYPHLKKILDVEKLHRKMNLSLLTPYGFYTMHTSYCFLQKITDILKEGLDEYLHAFSADGVIQGLKTFQEAYTKIFNVNELQKYSMINMTTSIFKAGIFPEIDALHKDILTSSERIQAICEKLSFYIISSQYTNQQKVVKFECNDRYGYHLYITETRSKTFKKAIQNLTNKKVLLKDLAGDTFLELDLSEVQFIKRNSNVHIEFPDLDTLTTDLALSQQKIQALNRAEYLTTCKTLYETHKDTMKSVVDLIGFIDLNTTFAKLAIENSYCRPEILMNAPPYQSRFEAKDIRHPIVEKVQVEIPYVPNNVSLSEEGMLLFGTNACGKSTLMKSIGLTIVMAQAGIFVPCSSFKFSPYTQIFTRILNNDNIFKRQSSFAVEMSELRGILKRADKRSLVLGDELCSGTETTSALSIVSAGLKKLSDLKCSFIFTSHLHELMDIPLVQEISNLIINHLTIEYDEEKDLLIYHRNLVPGSGPPIYGLEVCKAMDLGDEFVSEARAIQLLLTGTDKTLLTKKASNYNAQIKMDECQVCSSAAEHTHHIQEQCVADENGMIQHFHKNVKHNLVPLCESCHHKVHNENLRIYGYHFTNDGIQLNYEYIELTNDISTTKKKYNAKQIKVIQGYQANITDKSMKKTHCLKELELQHHIQISMGTFNKILKGEY